MKKLLIRLFVFLLAVTSVFGLAGLNTVKAADSTLGEGFKISTVAIRGGVNGDDFVGIRFTTSVTADALAQIKAEAGEGVEVKFGTEIIDANSSDPDATPVDICNVSTLEQDGYYLPNKDGFTYSASITFNEKVFAIDMLAHIRKDSSLTSGKTDAQKIALYDQMVNEESITAQESYLINAYKLASYAELLKATSYYEISGKERVYTKSVAHSMRLIANYYEKEDAAKLPADWINGKYTVVGGTKTGYLSDIGKELIVNGLDASKITSIAYGYRNIGFSVVDGKLVLDSIPAEIAKPTKAGATSVTLYAFDANNAVTTLNLEYVTLAIDEVTDFKHLSADFTFDQETYEELREKYEAGEEGALQAGDLKALKDYLQACQDQAYKYYDGYYVLVNDIDFAGVNIKEVIPHYAATTMSKKYSAYDYWGLDRAPLTYNAAENTYSLVSGATSSSCTQATITAGDKTYTFPRVGKLSSGTETIWLINNLNTAYNTTATYQLKAGFMGTFDGQGHVISNLNTQYVDTSINFAYTGSNGISKRVGSGLFGIISEGAVIKNLAFDDVNLEGAPAFATVLNAQCASGEKSNITFENIYVSDEEVNDTGKFYGTFYIYGKYRTPKLNNVVINIPNIEVTTENTFVNGTYGGTHTHFSSDTARQAVTNLYIATKNPEQLTWGTNNKGNSTKHASIDVTVATDMAGLFSATVNDHGTEKTMAESFANNSNWKVVDKAVYWKNLYLSTFKLNKESAEFNYDNYKTGVEVGLVDSEGNPIDGLTLKDSDIFSYQGGNLTVKNYISGEHEVIFTYEGKEFVLQVELLGVENDKAYLSQIDGEIVNHGLNESQLNALDGVLIKVDGATSILTVENGKLYVDLKMAGISQTDRLTAIGSKQLIADTDAIDYTFTLKYVTLAIDEATDFSALSADFTFDQATYEGLVEAGDLDAIKAYLQSCQDQAYTYFDGYAVLVKDIDFAGVKIEEVIPHYAATTMTKKYAQNGAYPYYALDRAPLIYNVGSNTYSLDAKAVWDDSKDATIKLSDGSEYTFPRVGKTSSGAKAIWLVNNLNMAYNVNGTNIPLKAGFMGTFDGQGYVISNLNTQYIDESFIVPGIKANDKETGQIGISKRVGAGLFGIITEGAVIKNFALENVNLEGAPAFATVLNARTSSTSNITFENIYISDEEVNGTGDFYGTFYIIGRYRTPKLINVVINIPNIEVTTDNYFVNGSYGGAHNHFGNKTARQSVTNLYIATKNPEKLTWLDGNGTSYKSASIDVTVATDMAGLFSATVNDHEDDANMGELLANNYWAFVDANGNETYDKGEVVHWAKLVPAIPQA